MSILSVSRELHLAMVSYIHVVSRIQCLGLLKKEAQDWDCQAPLLAACLLHWVSQ